MEPETTAKEGEKRAGQEDGTGTVGSHLTRLPTRDAAPGRTCGPDAIGPTLKCQGNYCNHAFSLTLLSAKRDNKPIARPVACALDEPARPSQSAMRCPCGVFAGAEFLPGPAADDTGAVDCAVGPW